MVRLSQWMNSVVGGCEVLERLHDGKQEDEQRNGGVYHAVEREIDR